MSDGTAAKFAPGLEGMVATRRRLSKVDGSAGRLTIDGFPKVEQTAVELLREYRPGRNLDTNVEFYTALLLHGLRLPTELFTPTFAVGRVAGWTAHCFEQRGLDRIIRPQPDYVGPEDRAWVPLEER